MLVVVLLCLVELPIIIIKGTGTLLTISVNSITDYSIPWRLGLEISRRMYSNLY